MASFVVFDMKCEWADLIKSDANYFRVVSS
jgi:hypothetical protein